MYTHGSGCRKVTDDDWADFGEKIVKRYRRMLDEGGFGSVTYRPSAARCSCGTRTCFTVAA